MFFEPSRTPDFARPLALHCARFLLNRDWSEIVDFARSQPTWSIDPQCRPLFAWSEDRAWNWRLYAFLPEGEGFRVVTSTPDNALFAVPRAWVASPPPELLEAGLIPEPPAPTPAPTTPTLPPAIAALPPQSSSSPPAGGSAPDLARSPRPGRLASPSSRPPSGSTLASVWWRVSRAIRTLAGEA
jgi:hypothetical protein